MADCPFCRALSDGFARSGSALPDAGGIAAGEGTLGLVAVLDDGFPLTPGHRLVVPVRHVARLGDLDAGELSALWRAVGDEVLRVCTPGVGVDGVSVDGVSVDGVSVDGVNVGVNDGAAAGQTVPHVHVHVIPRRWGDTADPRGGVRWVVPERARYWAGEPRG